MRVAACFLLLLAPVLAAAQAGAPQICAGSVYVDGNGNSHRDRSESGLPGVAVSDGEHLVRSDARGYFQLDIAAGRSLFVIKPAGYLAPRRADGLPDTWVNRADASAPKLRYGGLQPTATKGCRDFGLQRDPRPASQALELLVFGDPQLKSLIDADYWRRDILDPILTKSGGKAPADLAISLGDIVNDDLSLYPTIKQADAGLKLSWLHAPGNHDLDFDAKDDEHSLDSFHQAFGPDSYAWEESQANFIVLDDIIYQPGQKPAYIGGLRESQFRFLESYLARADRQRLLVISLHIPVFDVPGPESFRKADRERLFALLKDFPNLLILSAHTHYQQHFFHDARDGWQGAKPLHEYNVGAACGAFWTGVKDAQGIPAATMADGTPNGYARISMRDGKASQRWYVARAPEDQQISLHAPKVLRRGAYPAFGVYANVYMGHADTVVEWRVDGGEWKPMLKVLQGDPDLRVQNALDEMATNLRGYDRSPEAANSTHLWRAVLPTDLGMGEHRVEVRAQVDDFGEARAQASYRLDDASP
jgi:hypothetical protein